MLFLIRHGETDWNAAGRIQGTTDIPLNAAGREQASRLALTLARDYPAITAVYTSTLCRARETGEIIAKALKLPCTAVDGLEELCFGAFEGKTFADAALLYPESAAAIRSGSLDARAPEGESARELLTRAANAMLSIAASCRGDAAIVTHGRVIGRLFEQLAMRPESTDSYTRVENGSVRALDPALLEDLMASLSK